VDLFRSKYSLQRGIGFISSYNSSLDFFCFIISITDYSHRVFNITNPFSATAFNCQYFAYLSSSPILYDCNCSFGTGVEIASLALSLSQLFINLRHSTLRSSILFVSSAYPINCTDMWNIVNLTCTDSSLITHFNAILKRFGAKPSRCFKPFPTLKP
jgi:hypothetical protein